jgi:hypothetical protein
MFDSTQYIFFSQLVGTTYECIWDIFCLNLEKASKMNREAFDRKIQLSKKYILCSESFIDGRNSILFQVQNQLLEVQVNTAFPTYLACTKLRTAGVNMQIPLTTTLINSWTDNKPYTFRRKPEQNSNESGYHFSDKECFSRKLH